MADSSAALIAAVDAADPAAVTAIVTSLSGRLPCTPVWPDGHTAFSRACSLACSAQDEKRRQAASECAAILSPHFSPSDVPVGGCTHFAWALRAGLVDVVAAWLPASGCHAATEAEQPPGAEARDGAGQREESILSKQDKDGHSPFTLACHLASNKPAAELRTAYARGAMLLADSGKVAPDSRGANDLSALHWASSTGQIEALIKLLAHPRCTPAVLSLRDAQGHCPFSLACARAVDGSASARQCAVAFGNSGMLEPGALGWKGLPAVYWASYAGLPDVLSTLLSHPSYTPDLLTARDLGGHTAFSKACVAAVEAKDVGNAVQCVVMMARFGKVQVHTAAGGMTHLQWAERAGIHEAVTALLADATLAEVSAARTLALPGQSVEASALMQPQPAVRFVRACMESLTCHLPTIRAAARAEALTLAKAGEVRPGAMADGATILHWSARAGLSDMLAVLLAHPACDAAALANVDEQGVTALAACALAVEPATAPAWAGQTWQRRADYAECARLLAQSGKLQLGAATRCRTAAHWLCGAGFSDALSALLLDPGCTPEVLALRDGEGHTPFSLACSLAIDNKTIAAQRKAYAQCGKILGESGKLEFRYEGTQDMPALWCAAGAGLPAVVATLLAQPWCTQEVLAEKNPKGFTAFGLACSQSLRVGGRNDAGACAALLAHSGKLLPDTVTKQWMSHVRWAVQACLPDALAPLLQHPRCSYSLLTEEAEGRETALTHALMQVTKSSLEEDRVAAAQCAQLLLASGKVQRGMALPYMFVVRNLIDAVLPDLLSGTVAVDAADILGIMPLHRAVMTGSTQDLAALLADPACTPELLTHLDACGHTPFSAACELSTCDSDLFQHFETFQACTLLLVSSGKVLPDTVGGGEQNHVWWAVQASSPDVLEALLAHPACTEGVVTRSSGDYRPPFAQACSIACEGQSPAQRRRRAAACAVALAKSGKIKPGDTFMGQSYVCWAAFCGQPDALAVLLADVACDAAAVNGAGEKGQPALVSVCGMLRRWYLLRDSLEDDTGPKEWQLTGLKQCAVMLVKSNKVDFNQRSIGMTTAHWVAFACPEALAVLLQADPRRKRTLFDVTAESGSTPFVSACLARHLGRRETTQDGDTCAMLLVCSGVVEPGTIVRKKLKIYTQPQRTSRGTAGNGHGSIQAGQAGQQAECEVEHEGTHLLWAVLAGLPDVLTILLDDDLCTSAVVARPGTGVFKGHTPFTLACAYSQKPDVPAADRHLYLECAKVLLGSGHVAPDAVGHMGASAVWWATFAGAPSVLGPLLADTRCTAEVLAVPAVPQTDAQEIHLRDLAGTTALELALRLGSREGDCKTVEVRQHAQCVQMLVDRHNVTAGKAPPSGREHVP